MSRESIIIASHADWVRRLGLDTLDGVRSFRQDGPGVQLIKDHRNKRDILCIRPAATEGLGESPALFLKRIYRPYRKDGLKSLLVRGRVRSLCRQEWDNYLALRDAGMSIAEPVAVGDVCGPLWEHFSFILTGAARGNETVEDFLARSRDAALRRRVIRALAAEVRKMHDAGLASPDLFTRHFFLDLSDGQPRFCLIDMARLDHRTPGRLPDALRARDMAALNATAPLRFVSRTERAQFLKAYAGAKEHRRRLVPLVRRRVGHLLKKRKYADFLTPGRHPGSHSSALTGTRS